MTVPAGGQDHTDEREGHTSTDGRYRLDRRLSSRDAAGGLWRALDHRLGRQVLVQRDEHVWSSIRIASRMAANPIPGIAPLLDAGQETDADGTAWNFAVYPDSTWTPLAAVTPTSSSPSTIAAIAAQLVAVHLEAQTVCGTSVSLSADDVIVDPEWSVHDLAERGPLLWMPAVDSGRNGQLAGVVAELGNGLPWRHRRRWSTAVQLLARPHGRRAAVRLLADLADVDPRSIGMSPTATHQAAAPRRSFDRRVFTALPPLSEARS